LRGETGTRARRERSLKLFAWNGRAGAASNVWQSVARGADLCFLQEIKPPDIDVPHLWDAVPGRAWGSALVARRGRIVQVPLVGYEGWVTGGRVRGLALRGRFTDFYAFSVHVPSPGAGRRRKSYAREAGDIAAKLRRLAGREATLILGGDFNVAMGRRRVGDPVPMSAAEHHALDRIAARPIGLVSVWERCNPGLELAQTLRWMKNPAAKYHCDGFFVAESMLKGASCDVLESPEIRRASDHNPVVALLR
jgi:endonuclease/exonuclease/phosphatase family metal-dependent hydrolase